MKFQQQPDSLMMVRPAAFGFNAETASSNVFQQESDELTKLALGEFGRMVDVLRSHDVRVLVFEDSASPVKPDAIFPNNWVSFQPDGSIVLYPMMAENRRIERRSEFLEVIKQSFKIQRIIDLSHFENENKFLEGTGSVVFDHANRCAYACRSVRTHEEPFAKLCEVLGYQGILFDAVDENGKAIYHTNVMMSVGEKFAVVCLDSIRSDDDQERVLNALSSTEHKVVAISYEQMRSFAGNIMEVKNQNGEPFVLLSATALKSLLPGQVHAINQFAELIVADIPSIEKIGGGGVRCMVAGIHLPPHS